MVAPFSAEIKRLRRSIATTSAVLLSITLGIGGTAAVFSVLDAVVLHPLPYTESDQLVTIGERTAKGAVTFALSIPSYRDWQRQATAFSSLGAYREFPATIGSVDGPERVFGAKASPAFFDALRARLALGRLLREEDLADGAMLLSDGFWRTHFGGDPGVIGRALEVDGTHVTVAGVLDPSFRTPGQEPIDVWLPLRFHEPNADRRDAHIVATVGRLRSGVTVEAAQSELDVLESRLPKQDAATDAAAHVIVRRLSDQVVGNNGPPLVTLFAAVVLVLLMASINVGGLLLARDVTRQREFAVRIALGARSTDLAWHITAETAILLVGGTGLGLLLADWGLGLVKTVAPPYLHTVGNARINGPIVAVSIALALLSGCLVAGFQLVQAARMNVFRALRQIPSGSVRLARTRRLIVIAELTLAVALAADAAVVLHQLSDVWPSHPGFDATRMITARFVLNSVRFPTPSARRALYRSIVDRLEHDSSIDGAALASILPMDRFFMAASVRVGTTQGSQPVEVSDVQYRAVSPNFFGVLRIPIVSGRTFTNADDERSPVAVIVNETLRRRLDGAWDVLGLPVTITASSSTRSLGGDLTRVGTVVGIAGDTQEMSNPTAIAYVPFVQHPMSVLSIVVRAHSDRAVVVKRLRADFNSVEPTQAADIGSYDDIENWIVALPRFYGVLIGLFAATAIVLVVVGLAGLLVSTVAHRRAEIGIRRVLGATEGDTIRLILNEGAVLCLIGGALGMGAAVISLRAVKAVIPMERSQDVPGLLVTVAAVITVALLASCVAVRRAARIDPRDILRVQ